MIYDLTFLLKEEGELKNIQAVIESFGKIVKENKWGEKILAYPIKKVQRAYFFNYEIDLDNKKTSGLRKKLDFDDKIMRYLLIVKS